MSEINLYHGDCMEALRSAPDNHWDLAICDPPYGINATDMKMGSHPKRKGNGQYPGVSTADRLKGRLNSGSGKLKNRILNKSDASWDNQKPDPEYFRELLRVSKNQIIWGGNYFTLHLPESRGWICWDKVQPWENFSQFELAWSSFDSPAALFRYSNTGGANTKKKIHPTEKPIALYKWLLSKYAPTGSKILDTHSGSGNIAIACHEMGYDLDAYEIRQSYWQDSVDQFNSHKSQQRLFTPQEMYNV